MRTRRHQPHSPGTRRPALVLVATAAALVALGVAAETPAATTPTVKAARNAGLNRTIVVTGAGRTLYRRTGEHSGHVLCSGSCTSVWPPLTVASTAHLVRGPGVTGTLSKFRRPDGRWQVTLRGVPLYRYAPDTAAGQAKGQGLGGIWFVLPASTALAAPPPPSTPGY
jgi:predicted lipoprotein with Yx(FWY)xxD motif